MWVFGCWCWGCVVDDLTFFGKMWFFAKWGIGGFFVFSVVLAALKGVFKWLLYAGGGKGLSKKAGVLICEECNGAGCGECKS